MKNSFGTVVIIFFLTIFALLGMYHDSHKAANSTLLRRPSSESNPIVKRLGAINTITLKNKVESLAIVNRDGFWILEKNKRYFPVKMAVVNDLLELAKISQKNLKFKGMDQTQFRTPPVLFEIVLTTTKGATQQFKYLMSNPLDQSLIYEYKGMYYQAYHSKTYYSHINEAHLTDKKIFNLDYETLLSLNVKNPSNKIQMGTAHIVKVDGKWRDHQNRIVHPKIMEQVLNDLNKIEIERPLENVSLVNRAPALTLELAGNSKTNHKFIFYPAQKQKNKFVLSSTLHQGEFLLSKEQIQYLNSLQEFGKTTPEVGKLFY